LADPKAHLDLEQMRASARADSFGVHTAVDDPATADLILFVETSGAAGYYFEAVRRNPVFRRHRAKSYLFSSTDRVIPFLPGVFASIERRWYWPRWTRSGHYLGVHERPGLQYDLEAKPVRLFSFLGTASADPVRAQVLALDHPEGQIFDAGAEAGEVAAGLREAPSPSEYLERYVRSIEESAFVICPRGGGTSSFRLFETMMLGRVPVIVSDQMVLPSGPRWEEFALRVPEGEVASIPALLEARRDDAAAMGGLARETWLEWFSPQAGFHRTVEWCLELASAAPARTGFRGYAPYLQMLRPYHGARWALKRVRS
jgi:hypothetical protein